MKPLQCWANNKYIYAHKNFIHAHKKDIKWTTMTSKWVIMLVKTGSIDDPIETPYRLH